MVIRSIYHALALMVAPSIVGMLLACTYPFHLDANPIPETLMTPHMFDANASLSSSRARNISKVSSILRAKR
jgi:hypothetical protein